MIGFDIFVSAILPNGLIVGNVKKYKLQNGIRVYPRYFVAIGPDELERVNEACIKLYKRSIVGADGYLNTLYPRILRLDFDRYCIQAILFPKKISRTQSWGPMIDWEQSKIIHICDYI